CARDRGMIIMGYFDYW
nr:immunoglobulin heavy chain junction region [Macaca mulatta]MOX14544.1 immunoglobulin heavy chain junction region [Macaca mulatta]MOX14562.1 immunoglobulin heavy chain junction region [Macaca mulatta]MOX14573.1 immunoglobulin heavy chain junction region [Macaca mulatta]MOX14587.1 immunoglobulin heavy chain junction region [Macaca mulatta]